MPKRASVNPNDFRRWLKNPITQKKEMWSGYCLYDDDERELAKFHAKCLRFYGVPCRTIVIPETSSMYPGWDYCARVVLFVPDSKIIPNITFYEVRDKIDQWKQDSSF